MNTNSFSYCITYTSKAEGRKPLIIEETIADYSDVRNRFNDMAKDAANHCITLGTFTTYTHIKVRRNFDDKGIVLEFKCQSYGH